VFGAVRISKGERAFICAAMLAGAALSMAFAPADDALDARSATQAAVEPVSPAMTAKIEPRLFIGLRKMVDGPEADAAVKYVEKARKRLLSTHADTSQWRALVNKASRRFGVPKEWILAVLTRESGGRTSMNGHTPIRSHAGAMGLMQVMPGTYAELRHKYGLGRDPYDPHDNIMAATAYLKELKQRFGFPNMFAAYNQGPGNFQKYTQAGRRLPRETRDYLAAITGKVSGNESAEPSHSDTLRLTSL
jgi:soluble lytic murein transglycosylase-like protein